MTPAHEELIREFQQFAQTSPDPTAFMQHIVERLHQQITRYNWVGFYLLDPSDPSFLLVGPFVGSFTGNGRIPIASGLCGAAVTTGKTVVVHDVSKDPRYLAGSTMVKCEVVVPIFANRNFVAELDIESYFMGTFEAPGEVEFVEKCAVVVGEYLSARRAAAD